MPSSFSRAAAITGALFVVTEVVSENAASAQQCSNPTMSTCINSDTLWPHAGPQRFVAVGGTETVTSGQVGFGLVATYLSRPILLNAPTPGVTGVTPDGTLQVGTSQYAVDDQVNANFLFAYGITDQLELDVAAPVTLVQNGAGTSSITGGRSLRDTAVRDMRFGLAYAIVPRARVAPDVAVEEGGKGRSWSLAARMIMTAPIGDNRDFAGERTVVYAPSISADYRVSRLFFGTEVGARIRPIAELAGARVGTQVTAALGAGVDILPQELLSFLAEGRVYSNLPEQRATSFTPSRTIAPAEWLAGLRSAPFLAGDISFYAGGGGPIPITDDPITVPRFRFVLGVSYAPLRRDSDRDTIPDRNDPCPRTKGVPGYERPGCAPLPGESTK
ncbi:MAG: hypothetical protein KIT84_24875 [Labilithrix sp.]|nr:hypothetical protein [Labilithrix sp.]MCW5814284.1 hypothetical protein [Labilithrix sp.]